MIISGWMSRDADLGHRVLAGPADPLLDLRRATARAPPRSARGGSGRPATSFSRSRRAASRRTGSKLLRTTASGVSSMIRLTPVVASKARMLRPSRPMIRPFISSLGSVNTLTVDSAVCSDATRWIAIVTIFRARSSPSSRACCSISRTCAMAARFASSTVAATSSSRASDEVMPATRSSWIRCCSAAFSSRARTSLQLLVAFGRARATRSSSLRVRARSSSSVSEIRRSSRAISSRRAFTSSSASRRICEASTLASSFALRRVWAAPLGRDELLRRPGRASVAPVLSSVVALDLAMLLRTRNPAATPADRATTPTMTADHGSSLGVRERAVRSAEPWAACA